MNLCSLSLSHLMPHKLVTGDEKHLEDLVCAWSLSFASITIHQPLRVFFLSQFPAETVLMNLCAHHFK